MRIIALIFYLIISIFSAQYVFASQKEVCIKDTCITCDVAQTSLERAVGLMHRNNLSGNNGMLFIFEADQAPTFWMKNMNFSLDIIWIDAKMKVVDISKNVVPCDQNCPDIIAPGMVKYVIEVNSGFADEHNIRAGDQVILNLD